MKRLAFIFLLTSSVMFSATHASAQLSPGHSGYSSAPRDGSDRDYWHLIRQLGYCLSSSKADESFEFLATEPGSQAEGEAWDSLFRHRRRNPCMRRFSSATMLRAHVRGSIAQAIVSRAFDDSEERMEPVFHEPEIVSNIHDFADCYVASNFADAKMLITQTRISSEGELQYVQELAGGFGSCLPQGSAVRIEPTAVRLAIAEALFRTMRAPSGQAAFRGVQ